MDLVFKTLIGYVSRRSGVKLEQYRENYLRRRIEFRMRVLGINSYAEYLRVLRSDEEEIEKLLNTITINVTEFMRDRTPFEFFKRQILPEIAEKKKKARSNVIRVWSAGCSCGEEPYSIAICIHEVLGDGWNVSIYATDIDEECLKAAREGIYTASQLRNLSRSTIEKYFEEVDGKYKVKSIVRRWVRFKRHDLTAEPPVSRYLDVVFCRNVMIYFNESQKEKVISDFYDALVSGGYLIIGKSETLPASSKDKFECVNLREKIYRKV